jgi:hypothetical protein
MTAIDERSTVTDVTTKAPGIPAWSATSGSMPDQPQSGKPDRPAPRRRASKLVTEVVGLTGQTRLVRSNSLNASMSIGLIER